MIKRTLLLATIITLSLANTFARDISEKRNLFGINGGFGITTIGLEKTNSDAKKFIKFGGMFGVNFEHRFKKVAAIELGINYTNKGAQQKIEGSLFNRSFYRFNFHSIEVPLLFKFYVGRKKIFNINVGGYASYAVNVQSRTKIDLKDNSIVKDSDTKVNNLLSDSKNPKDANGQRAFIPFDAGANIGFEFISKSGFGAGARVQQGFVDYTNPKFIINDNRKVYHTSVLFYAIVKI